MKFLFLIFTLISSNAYAQLADSLLEAQTIIVVEAIDSKNMQYCVVTQFSLFRTFEGKTMWNEHYAKPLPYALAQKVGISFARENGHDCPVSIGQVVSGVLTLVKSGHIFVD